MKKIMAILGGIGVIYAAGYAGSSTHALARDHFQGSVLESVSATFNITDRNLADREALDDLKIIIDDMKEANKAIKSPEVEKQIKRLERSWEEGRRRLKHGVNTYNQMIARMSKRQNVTMR